AAQIIERTPKPQPLQLLSARLLRYRATALLQVALGRLRRRFIVVRTGRLPAASLARPIAAVLLETAQLLRGRRLVRACPDLLRRLGTTARERLIHRLTGSTAALVDRLRISRPSQQQ